MDAYLECSASFCTPSPSYFRSFLLIVGISASWNVWEDNKLNCLFIEG